MRDTRATLVFLLTLSTFLCVLPAVAVELKLPSEKEWHVDPSKVKHLSWSPRAWVYHGFLADEECDHLIQEAKAKLEKSMVADNASGKSVASEIRTSSGMFLKKGQDEIIKRIEKKIAAWTFIPLENGESIQVLRYEEGQKYEPHFDYFHDKHNIQQGGHRIATVLMYLTDVEAGGETVFPNADPSQHVRGPEYSECAQRGLAVKPRKGDALLFFSLHPDATTDEKSLHGGCPVLAGEKWSATKWMHVSSFDLPKVDPSSCEDRNDHCAEWAAYGECTKNPDYMIGSSEFVGACRKSCKVC